MGAKTAPPRVQDISRQSRMYWMPTQGFPTIPFRHPLAADTLRDLWHRHPDDQDVQALAWEIKQLRATILRGTTQRQRSDGFLKSKRPFTWMESTQSIKKVDSEHVIALQRINSMDNGCTRKRKTAAPPETWRDRKGAASFSWH